MWCRAYYRTSYMAQYSFYRCFFFCMFQLAFNTQTVLPPATSLGDGSAECVVPCRVCRGPLGS